MPEKYHEFIQPSIRKVFIDIPSISRLTKEISSLKGRVRTLSAEAKDLDRRCQLEVDTYRRAGKESVEKRKALELENNWLRDQYESLKVKYQTHLYVKRFPPLLPASHTSVAAMTHTPHLLLGMVAATSV